MIEIQKVADIDPQAILECRGGEAANVDAAVADILAEVRLNGDAALLNYTERFDGVRPACLRVGEAEIDAACREVGETFLGILREAAENIRNFHQRQVRQGFVQADTPGIVMGQKLTALARVGVYVPGGTAAYPSTVLMDVIPAQIAGVKQIVMVSPPDTNGQLPPAVLAAARIAGVTDIFTVGGAQAVAALAYGTESIPRVDKIVGPGNIYVATAKKMVYGRVDIDMIAGPSDILVLADDSANAAVVAADMLGQAEHDPLAAAVLITTSAALAKAVAEELPRQLAKLPRREIAEKSLRTNGKILLAASMEEGVACANALAPEHMELSVAQPFSLLPQVQNAGSIFLGHHTPEALGDYFAGPNHTLPTAGTARFYSPLSVDDFIKKSSYLYYSKEALAAAGEKVQAFAQREGLHAHAESVRIRLQQQEEK